MIERNRRRSSPTALIYVPIGLMDRIIMIIPTYEEAAHRAENENGDEEPTPLDIFIHENEPAGKDDEKKFRKGLKELIEYLTGDSVEDSYYAE